jgi:hypothetical protein
MNRVVSAARLHLIGGQSITYPWLIMASSLAINLVIFASITAKGGVDDNPSTGGLLSLYAVVMIVFSQAMNKQFAFALGFSLTRRTYLLGSALFALALSLGSALALYALYGIERATGGWWMDLSFFGVYGLGDGNPVLAVLGYAAPMMALITLGTLLGGINARWGPIGLYVAGLVGLIVGGALSVIMTYAEAWTGFGNWFDDQPTAALLAGYPWIIAVLLAGGTYLVARRTAA